MVTQYILRSTNCSVLNEEEYHSCGRNLPIIVPVYKRVIKLITVNLDITNQLLIEYSVLIRYCAKKGSSVKVHQIF
jgi:hypothetical protein